MQTCLHGNSIRELIDAEKSLSLRGMYYKGLHTVAGTKEKTFTDQSVKQVLPRTQLTPGGGGIQKMQDGYKDHLKLLQWIAALVHLVACANIANLLLVRDGRQFSETVSPVYHGTEL